ncbi:FecR family protein [Salmonirosea aquatica]|uniref:DUF4974 domain-containing protein n=1 Tax=Salmonirosea aquatica TaxID=2654236 RepID=A0A7C9F580_9BACT|nr:DUF4974 domain-containing protein [Cytophagaceae bacterium SJW1-29]
MEKERYSDFKAPDFLLDDDFLAWLRGEDPAAEESWQQWLAENPAGRVEVEKARLLGQAMVFRHRKPGADAVDDAWQKLSKNTGQGTLDAALETEGTPGRVIPLWVRLAAASVVLVMLAVWIGKDYYSSRPSSELSRVQTANGQQLAVTLTDGTTVRLNAGSTLTYPETFLADKREVRLKGEAYFEVAPNATAPFLIRTGEVDVQVIGTKFTVKAYPESELVKVAVVEGKVAVQAAGNATAPEAKEVLLTKDEMATVEKAKRELSVTGYDKNVALGWQNGILYFEKANFTQFLKQLERWYGVDISVGDDVVMDEAWRFSGKFERKPIDYILDVCRYPELFNYQVADKKVFITKK